MLPDSSVASHKKGSKKLVRAWSDTGRVVAKIRWVL